jgi:hemoglobin
MTIQFNPNKTMSEQKPALYARLGGYDAIAAVADDLLPRLRSDAQLGRFWANRAEDSIAREKQLLVNFLCSCAGGPMYYTGRNMTVSHKGMGITASDWDVFLGHARATLDKFNVPERERSDVLAFIESTKTDIVEKAV